MRQFFLTSRSIISVVDEEGRTRESLRKRKKEKEEEKKGKKKDRLKRNSQKKKKKKKFGEEREKRISYPAGNGDHQRGPSCT